MTHRNRDPGDRGSPRNGGPGKAPGWPLYLGFAVLAAGTLAAYGRTLSAPFVLDDVAAIADNTSIRRLWPIGPVLAPGPMGVGGRPVLNLSYALNFAAGGLSVAGYHWVNLAIHVLASWTLFDLVRRTLLGPVLREKFGPAATWLALAVGAIWAWHPVQTEAVTYVSQRAESLMGLFYLGTLYGFARGCAAGGRSRRLAWFSLSVVSCLAGVGTKEVIVTAPVLALLYDRTFVSGSFTEAWRRRGPVYAALAAALLPFAWHAPVLRRAQVGFGEGVTAAGYALVECRAVLKYLQLSVWPSPLVFDYGQFRPLRLADAWPSAAALAPLLAGAGYALWKRPAAGFAAAWFFLILAPSSTIVPIAGDPVAESRLYLPLAAVAAAAGLGGFALAGRRSLPVLGAVAGVLALASAHRNRDYASAQSLWADTVAKAPANARARNNLGAALLSAGGRPEAIAQFEEAVRLAPDFAEAHNNLGAALSAVPWRRSEAVAQYEEALRLKPDYAAARENLATALLSIPGRRDEAVAQYEEALRRAPGDPRAHYELANALSGLPGRLDDAIAQYREALRLKPDFPEAHNNLGGALLRVPGRAGDAAAEYGEALRLRPDSADLHFNLAVALLQLPGRVGEARGQLEEALRLRPEDGATRQLLSRLPAAQP